VEQQLAILFEDPSCIALLKPPGQFTLGTWAPPGERSLEDAVRRYLNPDDPGSVYLGIVHRLDRPTSGVLLWAKTPKAARRLSRQFESRRVEKEYWAVVERPSGAGTDECRPPPVPGDTGGGHAAEQTWIDWLTRAHASGKAELAQPSARGARKAVTRVCAGSAVALPPAALWLKFFPETGRTHQLRAQAAARGMPILGDALYGATSSFAPHAIALHARRLRLRHPLLQTRLSLVAPLPPEWHLRGIVLPPDEQPRSENSAGSS
jgi:23S rRNA pseudouridine1911/1915/1917 synthase